MDKITNNEIAICLFCYNRYEHLKITLEELVKFDLQHFEVFIFCDGPKDLADEAKTKKVRSLIGKMQAKGLKAEVHTNEINKGLNNSIYSGLNKVFSNYEKAIIIEDDILIRKGFLQFLEKGLDTYSQNEDVSGISGFSYINKPLGKNYFLPIGTSWGWATWKRVWDNVKDDPSFYKNEITRLNLVDKFNFGGYPFYNILNTIIEGKSISWDIQFYASFFLEEKLFLFPNVSLCKNIGFDNSGTHTSSENESFNSNDNTHLISLEMPESITLDSKMVKKIKSKMREMSIGSYTTRAKNIIKRVLRK